jgi:hypothetical protein
MMRFSRFALLVVPSLTLSLPSMAHAQRFVALAGGTNVGREPALEYQALSAGFAGQASIGYRATSRLRVRLDALASHFRAAQEVLLAAPLPYCYCSGGSSSATATGAVSVAAISVNELFDVLPAAPGGPGFYLIAGGGAYYLFPHPTAPALMRFGLSGGAGLELRLQGSSALFLEARYHGLMNASADARWLVPVTVGMRF